jgi:hypothetical protein
MEGEDEEACESGSNETLKTEGKFYTVATVLVLVTTFSFIDSRL